MTSQDLTLIEKFRLRQIEDRKTFYDILDGNEDVEIINRHGWLWADCSYNIQRSSIECKNKCLYCYARRLSTRFGRIQFETDVSENDEKKVNKGWQNRGKKNTWMVPSSHDIFPETVDDYIKVVLKMVKVGHSVLCVSKPRLECIQKICDSELSNYKRQFWFRFTITSVDEKILSIWEINAPSLNERIESLKYAYNKGFKTSISIEPLLGDPFDIIKLLILM